MILFRHHASKISCTAVRVAGVQVTSSCKRKHTRSCWNHMRHVQMLQKNM